MENELDVTDRILDEDVDLPDPPDVNQKDKPNHNEVSNAEAKSLQFVVYDEKKIYTRRKYVRRKKTSGTKQNESQETQPQTDNTSSNVDLLSSGFLGETSHPSHDLENYQLDPFGTGPAALSPTAAQALSRLAHNGPRCALAQTWFPKAILDENLVHCFVLYSVSFPWILRTPAQNLSSHPAILPWKIRAIQATNELLRDETRNTTDYTLVAIAILAAMERMCGNVVDMLKHTKGLEIIMQQRELNGDLDNICPIVKRAAEASISMANLLSLDGRNPLPIDDPTAVTFHTEHLRQRLKGSLFCLSRFSAQIQCASSTTFLGILQRIDHMLVACLNQAKPGAPRHKCHFRDSGDLLDDLWVSQGIFLQPLPDDSDPLIPAVARASWVAAVGTLIWILYIGLGREPDELETIKMQMLEWIHHPCVTEIEEYPLRMIREWGEYVSKLVYLKT